MPRAAFARRWSLWIWPCPSGPGRNWETAQIWWPNCKRAPLIREIYCFMVTGYEPADVRERLSLLQVTPEIWQKPLDGDKFLARLDDVLTGSKRSVPEDSSAPDGEQIKQ